MIQCKKYDNSIIALNLNPEKPHQQILLINVSNIFQTSIGNTGETKLIVIGEKNCVIYLRV